MKAQAEKQDAILHPTKAVVYGRVSHTSQLTKGDGLNSQEARCREFAKFKGYDIVEKFHETISGGELHRPAMTALLVYLRQNKKEGRVVIIDDISRFARDMLGHWALREQLREAGGILESPSIEFGEDADSIFRENILASVAQHQRQKTAEQTHNRMRGRLLNGYWPFTAGLGYRHVAKPGEGKILVRAEPIASIIQEAMEGYASGRFQTQTEVKVFLEGQPEFPKVGAGRVRWQLVNDILSRVLYAGYVESADWEVPARKGKHEGLVSLETFERIQQRLKEGAKAATRADINKDFPLRGMVSCADCGKPLTACWSTSKTGTKHPYYMCDGKGCPRRRKSIKRQQIEAAFVSLLQTLTPTENLVKVAGAMFKSAWNQRAAQADAMRRSCETEAANLEKQIQTLLDRIVEAGSSSVVKAYEKRIAGLERQKAVLLERGEKIGQRPHTFEELFELALQFLSSPWKLWNSGEFALKRLVLRLTFAEHLAYCPKEGFRTPRTTMPFKVLEGFRMPEMQMVSAPGLEPGTT